MNAFRPFILALKNRIEYVVAIILITTLAAFGLSLAQKSEYEARSRILVLQRQGSVDAFTASKSAEYIASLLDEAVYTDSFFSSLEERDDIVSTKFGDEAQDRRKQWAKQTEVVVDGSKGIMTIKYYDENRNEAQRISELITNSLVEESPLYHGAGETVTLRIIDSPTTSAKPVRPNILLNSIAGLAVGIGISVVYLLVISGARKERRSRTQGLHPEFENAQSVDFLEDGHVAATPSEHAPGDTFEPPSQSTVDDGLEQQKSSRVRDVEEGIRNWMK